MRTRWLLPILLVSGICDAAPPSDIGRLFFSRQERAEMDQQRQRGGNGALGERVVVDGFVKASGGSVTTWVNQVARHGSRSEQARLVQLHGDASAVQVTLPSGGHVMLKPGQIADLKKGTIRDGFEAESATASGSTAGAGK